MAPFVIGPKILHHFLTRKKVKNNKAKAMWQDSTKLLQSQMSENNI